MVYLRKTIFAYIFLIIAKLIGGASLVLFGVFLYGIIFTVVDLDYGRMGLLGWDAFLCLLFFAQHSIMIRKVFRKRLTGIIAEPYYRAFYALVSGVFLLSLLLLWQESGQSLFSLQGWARWLARGIFLASLGGIFWSARVMKASDLLGSRQALAHIRSVSLPSMPFSLQGPYKWMRHPMYFLVLLMIWCCPDLSPDRLLFNILFTGWMVLGTVLEEVDLVEEFGDDYRNYQRTVPMLVPWRIFSGRSR